MEIKNRTTLKAVFKTDIFGYTVRTNLFFNRTYPLSTNLSVLKTKAQMCLSETYSFPFKTRQTIECIGSLLTRIRYTRVSLTFLPFAPLEYISSLLLAAFFLSYADKRQRYAEKLSAHITMITTVALAVK